MILRSSNRKEFDNGEEEGGLLLYFCLLLESYKPSCYFDPHLFCTKVALKDICEVRMTDMDQSMLIPKAYSSAIITFINHLFQCLIDHFSSGVNVFPLMMCLQSLLASICFTRRKKYPPCLTELHYT